MVSVDAFDLHSSVALALVLNYFSRLVAAKVLVLRRAYNLARLARSLVLNEDLVFLKQGQT